MTPQSTTGVSPAELMFGRRLHTHLDNVRPDIERKTRQNQEGQKQGHDQRARIREFQVNDLVYAKNYGSGDAWLPGKITAIHGSMLFTVQLEDGRIVRKHTDQLRNRVESSQETSMTTTNSGDDLDFPVSKDSEIQETTTNSNGDVSSQTSPTENVDAEDSSSSSTTDEPQTENETTTEQSEQESTQSPPMP